jgi:hypothetical protein
MSKDNYSKMCKSLLSNLIDRNVVPTSYQFKSGVGLVRFNNTHGSYSTEETGTAKEIYYFLCGIQHAQMLALPCNKNID